MFCNSEDTIEKKWKTRRLFLIIGAVISVALIIFIAKIRADKYTIGESIGIGLFGFWLILWIVTTFLLSLPPTLKIVKKVFQKSNNVSDALVDSNVRTDHSFIAMLILMLLMTLGIWFIWMFYIVIGLFITPVQTIRWYLKAKPKTIQRILIPIGVVVITVTAGLTIFKNAEKAAKKVNQTQKYEIEYVEDSDR